MKKIITLSFTLILFAAAFAQTSKEEARRVILGEPKNSGGSTQGRDVILGGGNENRNYPVESRDYPYGSNEANANRINREYDQKIRSIQNNGTLTAAEKERMIRQLEKDRQKKLHALNKENGKQKKDKKHDIDDRKDNGKHKGWTKGKGHEKHDD